MTENGKIQESRTAGMVCIFTADRTSAMIYSGKE